MLLPFTPKDGWYELLPPMRNDVNVSYITDAMHTGSIPGIWMTVEIRQFKHHLNLGDDWKPLAVVHTFTSGKLTFFTSNTSNFCNSHLQFMELKATNGSLPCRFK